MEITVYAKERTTSEGKSFYTYLSKLKKKDGTELTSAVKFRDVCGQPIPERCPMNIKFDKKDANLACREFANAETGEVGLSHTLWISKWEEGSKFIDHSLDDFE